ncbi:MAG: HlyD family efflux transporter periplasmic adaptor subunit [Burkholderiales bacterium]|jgi:HlyD family secretion protein|nr:HlyD family efflux transporter periplasmic adaptor subunit [Burkholderiales bacterium]
MKKPLLIIVILVIAVALIAAAVWLSRTQTQTLTLYGNVDQRHIELAFADAERIAEIYVQEGATVEPGQPLAKLETRRLFDKIMAARARLAQAQSALLKLKNGTRPEEIDQARAAVAAAHAEAAFTEAQFERMRLLSSDSSGRAVSQQELDETRLKRDQARAKLNLEQKALKLAEIGARTEDIQAAEATLAEQQQNLEALEHQLDDATLKSPARAVIFRRLLEVGDMASPQRAVFSLSVISPKWVRAYLAEPELGRVKPQMKALVTTDALTQDTLSGTVSFIADTAEFTPKTVQTTELRTALVYEIRILVEDPNHQLRLGMPVTITFPEFN